MQKNILKQKTDNFISKKLDWPFVQQEMKNKFGLEIYESWINKIDNSSIKNRVGGSLASVIYCLDKGVDIFRVHDVHETQQAITIYMMIKCLKSK